MLRIRDSVKYNIKEDLTLQMSGGVRGSGDPALCHCQRVSNRGEYRHWKNRLTLGKSGLQAWLVQIFKEKVNSMRDSRGLLASLWILRAPRAVSQYSIGDEEQWRLDIYWIGRRILLPPPCPNSDGSESCSPQERTRVARPRSTCI
jgi:hypothetical protein